MIGWTLRITALTLAVMFSFPGLGMALPTREEVLQSVYPGADFRARRLFLTDQQMAEVEAAAGQGFPSPLVARYEATKGGLPGGRAYIDTHVVRTKNQSLLVCLDGEGKVIRVEVTAFLEPPEYQVPGTWLEQYNGRIASPDLQLNRQIRPIAGATLTAIAVTRAVRRVLVLDELLRAEGGER